MSRIVVLIIPALFLIGLISSAGEVASAQELPFTHWWAAGLAGLFFSGGLFVGYRLRARHLKGRAAELEAVVERRTEELKKHLEELENKNHQILLAQAQLVQSEKMASLGQLVAGVAHEINNPVTFISAGAPALERLINNMIDPLPPEVRDERFEEAHEQVREIVEVIQEGARRTTQIVRNLRSFSHLDEVEVTPADLHEMLDSTLSLLRYLLEERIEIVREYGELPLVECYVGQVNQVFMNLLANAILAIDGPGKITIRTEESGDPDGRKMVRVQIRDTGSGISQEVIDKIFDPFFTTRQVGQGTGLGLSISHGIVEKHGGRIEVESTVGQGTEMIVVLPVRLAVMS